MKSSDVDRLRRELRDSLDLERDDIDPDALETSKPLEQADLPALLRPQAM